MTSLLLHLENLQMFFGVMSIIGALTFSHDPTVGRARWGITNLGAFVIITIAIFFLLPF